MTEHQCINCGAPEAEPYELLVRNRSHDSVPLCDECHVAIERELDESA